MVHYLCEKVAVLYKGELVEFGNTDEVFRNPQHSYTKHYWHQHQKFQVKGECRMKKFLLFVIMTVLAITSVACGKKETQKASAGKEKEID